MNANRRELKIPDLRFPEFTGEWVEKRLGDLSQLITKGTTPQRFSEEGVNYVKIECLDGVRIDENKCLKIEKKIHQRELRRSVLEKDDILFAIAGATVGKVGVVPASILPANTNQALAIIRLKNKQNLIFTLQILQSSVMKFYISQSVSVGAQPNLSLAQIGNFEFANPLLPEQKRIASFLSAVDGRIEGLEKKGALLRDYKKGLMQKLFNQSLRFKDDQGNPFPDWEEKKIEDIFEITRGYVLAVHEMSQDANDEFQYPVYSSQTKNNGLTGYYNSSLYENSITWTTDGANAGDVKYRKGKFYCTNVCGVLISKEGFANQCVAELLNAVSRRYVSYVGNPKLMNNVMAKIVIQFPSLAEQQKIADCLSAVDWRIGVVEAQVAQTRAFKQGLLQQMFV